MRVTCLQENLQRALGRVGRAVATRTTSPVLSNVLIATDEGRLRFAATDMAVAVTTWIEADIQQEGRITIDARLIGEFVGTLPAGPVELEVDGSRFSLTITSGRDKATINGIDADDFPEIPTVSSNEGLQVEVGGQQLREMVGLVEFAAATDDSRPVLAGVLTRFEGTGIELASADGFRMAVNRGETKSSVEERQDVIVPARSYRELGRIIADFDEDIHIGVTPNKSQVVARIGDTEWVSRIIDGLFPDVQQIVPKEFATRVDLSREALLNASRRASYFARDNNDVVMLVVRPGEDDLSLGSVEVFANAAERGNSHSFVDASVNGPEVQIAFNGKYLADVLSVLKHGQVTIGINSSTQAGIIRPSGSETYTHVIMPMVIGG